MPIDRRTLLAAAALPLAAQARTASLTLLELYTSQGCSSCPPADAVLAELADRPGLLALSFHVDYWNRLGWPDPYSLADATRRQRQHAARLRVGYVYTPQLVVNGTAHVVGSDRGAVAMALAATPPALPIALVRDGAEMLVRLPDRRGNPPASVQAAWFADAPPVRVARGENAGRTLAHRNVVRRLATLGGADGAADWRLPLPPGQQLAVWMEAADGAVLAAART
jgi:hypothetical protein